MASPSPDLESPLVSYSPLPSSDRAEPGSDAPRRTLCFAVSAAFFLALTAAAILYGSGPGMDPLSTPDPVAVTGRGVKEGVSSKSSGAPMFLRSDSDSDSDSGAGAFPWTNTMLSSQRTGFHFQPERNWMNDPNGPMFYKGWYHLFYQYNPNGAVWDTISWGHSVSRDLLSWHHLPIALIPDKWYDITGVWSGSATILPDGRIVMLYTGGTDQHVQLQNVAVPANLSDPLLIEWNKIDDNPVMRTPPGIGATDFRDPSTAWYEESDSTWRVVVGSKDSSHNGIALVYSTKDFLSYTLLPGTLHKVEKVGMWECIDFYPIATSGSLVTNGLDDSVGPSQEIKHVLKASTEDNHSDYYAIGTYDPIANKWTPDDESLDVGIGLRYDWGKFYASKTFYDQKNQRRILWGWIAETDSEISDIRKGWASLQGIPRTILFDMKTRSNLLTWPIEEVESLRMSGKDLQGMTASAGSAIDLLVDGSTTQLDIEAEFEINKEALEAVAEADVEAYDCTTSGGAATRGIAGPFGLLVLANEGLSEQTAVYFYISKGSDGTLKTHFCQDETRSSKANDVVKRVVGHSVPVLEGEILALRVLVDHSIVESFAQGGRASATSRVYPTDAIGARVLLFNNATGATVTAKTLKVWKMNNSNFTNYESSGHQ